MLWKTLTLSTAGFASLVAASLVTSQPAAARPFCSYIAHDPFGKVMATGNAWAMKKSWACNRARRRCNRELERKRRHGKAGRGSCRKVVQAQP